LINHEHSRGHSYGTKFVSGADTLASLNSGQIGPVVDASDKFVSFTQAPSTAGDLASPDNFVESTITFSLPTGFAWEPINGASSGTFSISVQFEIFMSP
jgi:hypothetical protein